MSEETSAFGRTRRRFLTTSGAAGALALAGCVGGDDDNGTDDNGDDSTDTGDDNGGTTADTTTEVNWVMNPAEEAVDIEIQYQPLFEYLESEADVEINGVQTSDYSSTVLELQRGGGDFADTSPGAVAQIPDDIDVVGMRLAFGAERYFSLITTLADSDINELADLEGETVATAATGSVSGTWFPMLMLQQAGLDIGSAPDGDPVDFEWQPSDHDTAREQLVENPNVAAAGTGAFSTAAHVPQEQFDEMSDQFVDISVEYGDAGTREPELDLLAVSEPIPRAPIVARADWDDPVREELETLMLEAESDRFEHDDEELAEALGTEVGSEIFEDHQLWFNGIEPATVDDYEPVVELLNELGLQPEDL